MKRLIISLIALVTMQSAFAVIGSRYTNIELNDEVNGLA